MTPVKVISARIHLMGFKTMSTRMTLNEAAAFVDRTRHMIWEYNRRGLIVQGRDGLYAKSDLMRLIKSCDDRTCHNCGNRFQVSSRVRIKYCSDDCYRASRRTRERDRYRRDHVRQTPQICQCPVCLRTFENNAGNKKTCSATCRDSRAKQLRAEDYAANRDVYRQKVSVWRRNNPNAAAEISRRWRKKNKDRRRAYEMAYYSMNKVRLSEAARRRRAENLDDVRERERTYRRDNPDRVRATQMRSSLKEKQMRLLRRAVRKLGLV